jgi:hypothetical protein
MDRLSYSCRINLVGIESLDNLFLLLLGKKGSSVRHDQFFLLLLLLMMMLLLDSSSSSNTPMNGTSRLLVLRNEFE